MGVLVMSSGGFGKGRPPIGEESMVPKTVHVLPEQWEKAKEYAKNKSKEENRRVVAAEVYRNAVEAFFRNVQTVAVEKTSWSMSMPGIIYGGEANSIQSTPRVAYIDVPWNMDPACYALLVVGNSMQSEDGISIPAGHYAIFCPQSHPAPGALVHVEWEDKGQTVTTFKKYIPHADGSATFKPLNKSRQYKPLKRAKGEYEIKGVFVRSYDGKETA